jgi:hypothetical protein
MDMRIKDIELTQNFLENRLEEELKTISKQRAELDRKEKEAIVTMLREDQEKRLLVGSFIEASVGKIFGMRNFHTTNLDDGPDDEVESDEELWEDAGDGNRQRCENDNDARDERIREDAPRNIKAEGVITQEERVHVDGLKEGKKKQKVGIL